MGHRIAKNVWIIIPAFCLQACVVPADQRSVPYGDEAQGVSGHALEGDLPDEAPVFVTDPVFAGGAKGDNGQTDSTAAFVAALSAHSYVIVPAAPGAYAVNSAELSGKTFRLEFESGAKVISTTPNAAQLGLSNCNATIVNANLDGANLAKRGISQSGGNLEVLGGSFGNYTAADTFTAAIYGNSLSTMLVSGATISNVVGIGNGVLGDPSGAARGVYVNNVDGAQIVDCTITEIGGEEGDAIHFSSTCRNSEAIGNHIIGFSRRGIKIQGSNGNIVSNTLEETSTNVQSQTRQSSIEFVGTNSFGGRAVGNMVNTPSMLVAIKSDNPDAGGATFLDNTVIVGTNNTGENGYNFFQRGIFVNGPDSQVTNNVVIGGYYGLLMQGSNSLATENRFINPRWSAALIGDWSTVRSGAIFDKNHIVTTESGRISAPSAVRMRNVNGGSVRDNVFQSYNSETESFLILDPTVQNVEVAGNVANTRVPPTN